MKNRLLALLILLTGLIGCRRVIEWPITDRVIPVYQGKIKPQTPAMAHLHEGEWLAVFTAQHDSMNVETSIMMTRAGGLPGPWSVPVPIARMAGICRDPGIIQLKSGLVLVHFNIGHYDEENVWQSAGAAVIVSYDYGNRFSVPKLIRVPGNSQWQTAGRLMEMNQNQWILPMLDGPGLNNPGLVMTKDAGETWSDIHTVNTPFICTDWEVLKTRDSNLAALYTAGPEHLCMYTGSRDGGETWSVADPVNLFGIDPVLRQNLRGTVFAIYLDQTPSGLSMMASYDFGKTYENEQVLLASGYTAAPAVAVDEPDKLVLLYTAQDGLRLTVKSLPVTGIPRGISASADSGTVSLRWNPVAGAAYYRVYRSPGVSDSQRSNRVCIGSTAETFFTDSALKSGMSCVYELSAVTGSGRLVPGSGSEGELSRPIVCNVP